MGAACRTGPSGLLTSTSRRALYPRAGQSRPVIRRSDIQRLMIKCVQWDLGTPTRPRSPWHKAKHGRWGPDPSSPSLRGGTLEVIGLLPSNVARVSTVSGSLTWLKGACGNACMRMRAVWRRGVLGPPALTHPMTPTQAPNSYFGWGFLTVSYGGTELPHRGVRGDTAVARGEQPGNPAAPQSPRG